MALTGEVKLVEKVEEVSKDEQFVSKSFLALGCWDEAVVLKWVKCYVCSQCRLRGRPVNSASLQRGTRVVNVLEKERLCMDLIPLIVNLE